MWRWLNANHHGVTAMAAVVIGVAALFIAWDQARIMRRSEHAAMLPIVAVDHGFGYSSDRATYTLAIENKGVGPALIRYGKFVGGDTRGIDAYADRISPIIESSRSLSANSADGVTMAVGETLTLLSVVWTGGNIDQQQFAELVTFASNQEYEVCFCSVFDKCWTASTSAPPAPSKACSAASLAPPL